MKTYQDIKELIIEQKVTKKNIRDRLVDASPDLKSMSDVGRVESTSNSMDIKAFERLIQSVFKPEETEIIAPQLVGNLGKKNNSSKYEAVVFKNPENNMVYIVNLKTAKEALSPRGEDWESIITDKYNQINKLTPDNSATNHAEQFYPTYEGIGLEIAKTLTDTIGKSAMVQYGADSSGLSSFWTSYGGSNKTPKTDMYTKTHNISLKKKGGSQLMSAAKGEAIATFYAALEYMGSDRSNKKEIDSIMGQIEEGFDKVATTMSKEALDKLSKDKESQRNISPEDKAALEKYLSVENFHKELNKEIKDHLNFESNARFMEYFTFEAMSGRKKFASTQPVASTCIEFDVDKGNISKYIPLTKDGKNTGLTDTPTVSTQVKSIAKQVKLYVAWKSSKGNPYSSFRAGVEGKVQLAESAEPSYTFADVVRDTIRNDKFVKQYVGNLLEETIQLDEFEILRRAAQKIKKVAGQAVSFIKRIFGKIFNKAKTVIKQIAKLGKKAFSTLLKFFGVEVSTARTTIPKDIEQFVIL